MREGNGDRNLCVFGEKYTPNQHKIAREFILLDNTYCAGVNSSDGHQWTDSAIANEYVERQLTSGSPRSYPSGKGEDGLDALAWSSSGFIWDNAHVGFPAHLPQRQRRGWPGCPRLVVVGLHLG